MIGTSLSHYRIVEKLGQGGMGEVYRAEDTNLSLQVAIKVLPDEFALDAERLARFEPEAKLLEPLIHADTDSSTATRWASSCCAATRPSRSWSSQSLTLCCTTLRAREAGGRLGADLERMRGLSFLQWPRSAKKVSFPVEVLQFDLVRPG